MNLAKLNLNLNWELAAVELNLDRLLNWALVAVELNFESFIEFSIDAVEINCESFIELFFDSLLNWALVAVELNFETKLELELFIELSIGHCWIELGSLRIYWYLIWSLITIFFLIVYLIFPYYKLNINIKWSVYGTGNISASSESFLVSNIRSNIPPPSCVVNCDLCTKETRQLRYQTS